jgi:tRNA1Val (adenine37-N6)-methyltransferase
MNDVFRFKCFSVFYEHSFKVGTDAVLLGALAPVNKSMKKALDIGTGCGVIALMLLQRGITSVIGIEKDLLSASEAQRNSEKTVWSNSMQVLCDDFCDDKWAISSKQFDLIVSNPPFFSNSLRSPDKKRSAMRHNNESLPFYILIKHATAQLAPKGLFSVILPTTESRKFIEIAFDFNLFPTTVIHIKSTPEHAVIRHVLTFSFEQPEKISETTYCIKNSDFSFSEAYQQLTRDFYLNF